MPGSLAIPCIPFRFRYWGAVVRDSARVVCVGRHEAKPVLSADEQYWGIRFHGQLRLRPPPAAILDCRAGGRVGLGTAKTSAGGVGLALCGIDRGECGDVLAPDPVPDSAAIHASGIGHRRDPARLSAGPRAPVALAGNRVDRGSSSHALLLAVEPSRRPSAPLPACPCRRPR